MEYILDAWSAGYVDKYTIEECDVPGEVLMERAAQALVKEIVKRYDNSSKVLCVAGKGNNGGDAVVAAGLLRERGYNVETIEIKNINSEDYFEKINDYGYEVVVDGIFGIGLNKPVQGVYLSAVKYINQCGEHGSKVYAVDIASGINSSTGDVMGTCVKADYTVTFGYKKVGHVVYPGRDCTGELSVHDIGFCDKALENSEVVNRLVYGFDNPYEALKYLPERKSDSNKGSYGRVLVVAGSDEMPGACILASKSALRSGCGLVTACSSEKALNAVVVAVPEVILKNNEEKIQFENFTACLIGPGLGKSSQSKMLVENVIINYKNIEGNGLPEHNGFKGLVIDADAINILAEKMNELGINKRDERLEYIENNLPDNTVFTPHKKELSRLFNVPMDELESLIYTAQWLRNRTNKVFILKDAATIVVGRNKLYINQTGNNGMSTAGAGDVLAGIIVSFIAQQSDIFTAACVGVCLHGHAGDKARDKYSEYGVIAGDISDAIAEVMNTCIK